MRIRFGLGWQIALVAALFLGSLVVLLSSNLAALWLPQHETEVREQLSDASRRMAEAATPLLDELTATGKKPKPDWHRRLAEITQNALADLAGAEGGFYLAGDRDEFTGYAFPNDPHAPPDFSPPPPPKRPPPPKGPQRSKKKGSPGKHPPEPLSPRREPPPKERSFILAQCRASLTLDPDAPPVVQVLDVGPSRVMVVTEPVGKERPAGMATWVMIRLISPEQHVGNLRRYQVSTGLALAGILLSLVLTVKLGRTLRFERKQHDKLREELRRSEHLAALGKLLAGVAHEVRNPLAAIHSTIQLWERLPEQARNPAAAEPIVRAVHRLNALVSRLLFFVRTAYDQRRFVDLNAIVRDALALLSARAEGQGVALQTELAADMPAISGSAEALQQVVLNLATNSLQVMPHGGVLRCQTRVLGGPPRVELSVADTGPGITPVDHEHLFEPFWTTRPEGTGLGLALCREIVQQHGGRIELDRQPGWGAVFRVTLPVAETERKEP